MNLENAFPFIKEEGDDEIKRELDLLRPLLEIMERERVE